MRIIGIDPGIGRTGWGIIDVSKGKLEVQEYGCIETFKEQSVGERLLILYKTLGGILGKAKPDSFAIEELFFNTNTKTALVVGQARGVAFLAAAERDIPISVYTPLQVKIAVTGYGRGEKKQIGHMVKTLLHLDIIPKPDDTTDALAIAITHAFSYKMK
ncbi:MAG: crossover junction endodeoxyribonuclease RuvC [Candidatus Levyibacteriota bacterium]